MDFLDATAHALQLIVQRVVSVNPWWLLVGLALFEAQQAVRTRGWWAIIRTAYPDARSLRARDVCTAYLSGAGVNAIVPARLGDVLKIWLVRRRIDGGDWPTLAATLLPETLFDVVVGAALVIWAFSAGCFRCPPAAPSCPRSMSRCSRVTQSRRPACSSSSWLSRSPSAAGIPVGSSARCVKAWRSSVSHGGT